MTRRALLALLPLALAACAHAGPAAAPKATALTRALASADFFPTRPGTVWQYEVVGHPVGEPDVDYPGVETVELQGAQRKGGRTTVQLRALDDFSSRYRFPTLTWDEAGVTLGGVTYWGPMASDVDGHTIPLLQFPLTVGAKWNDGDWYGKALAEETVKVPAGSFKTWKIDVIGTYDNAYTAVGTYWIAPGTGIVKSQLNTPAGSFDCVMIPAGRDAGKAPAKPSAARRPFPVGQR